MRLTVHGGGTAPAVGMLATWDPFLPAHEGQLGDLRAHAEARGLAALALLLDPAPALLLNGPANWPVHSDVPARVARLRACGVAVGVLDFDPQDLGAGAEDLFDVVFAQAPLKEFWLKFGQTVGSGPRGNTRAVRLQGVRRRMGVRVLPADAVPEASARVRRHLAAGAPAAAAAITGRRAAFTAPPSGRLRLAWAPGEYAVVAFAAAFGAASGTAARVALCASDDGLCDVAWPAGTDRLEFVRGPGDAEADTVAA